MSGGMVPAGVRPGVASAHDMEPQGGRGPARSLVTLAPISGVELLIKSADRVRDLAEVFTPAATVQTMLDLLPAGVWAVHPSPTFLEPACGDGNFLAAILDRKLDRITLAHRQGALPAGSTPEAVEFHGLEALASIYAVDISEDNVIGGTPGHEVGARDRLLTLFAGWLSELVDETVSDTVMESARWIVTHNVQVGNMLRTAADGTDSGRDDLKLMEYAWDQTCLTVSIDCTTLGDVTATETAKTTRVMSLFGPPAPTPIWRGRATDLHQETVPGGTSEPAHAGHSEQGRQSC